MSSHPFANDHQVRLLRKLAIALLVPLSSLRAEEPPPPRELGRIAFRRGYDAALEEAKRLDRPLLVLFQEIPGCNTCTTYGDRVLSHPLVIEAAESLFVPVAVVNNVAGDDARILKSFNEPANNNPVVRILSSTGEALAPRVSENYTIPGLTGAMLSALKTANRPIPEYLQLLHDETDARVRGVQRATFAMHCFWEGEAKLGTIPGVISTAPATFQKLEVVEVEFDPQVVDFGRLLRQAMHQNCADRAFTRMDEHQVIASGLLSTAAQRSDQFSIPDKEPKYRLRSTPYQHIPMISIQATRVNAAVAEKRDPSKFLSPRQLALLETVKQHPNTAWPVALGVPNLSAAWKAANEVTASISVHPAAPG